MDNLGALLPTDDECNVSGEQRNDVESRRGRETRKRNNAYRRRDDTKNGKVIAPLWCLEDVFVDNKVLLVKQRKHDVPVQGNNHC